MSAVKSSKVLRQIERAGCTVDRTKSGVRVRTPSGRVFFTHCLLHTGGADHFALTNFLNDLRKAGVELP